MPEAKCTECGAHYSGWSLEYEENRVCVCGGELVIITKLAG